MLPSWLVLWIKIGGQNEPITQERLHNPLKIAIFVNTTHLSGEHILNYIVVCNTQSELIESVHNHDWVFSTVIN